MPSIASNNDLSLLLARLETLLQRVDDRLTETRQLPLIRSSGLPSKAFLSDDLAGSRELFSQPSFHIGPGSPGS